MSLGNSPIDWSFLFTRSQDGMLVLGPDGRVLDANPRACEMLGYPRDELLRLSTTDLIMPDEIEVHRARLKAAGQSAIPPRERRMRRKDGTVLPMDGSGLPLGAGRVLGILQDNTARRRLEGEARAGEALKAAILDAALDAVVSIDHEGRVIEFNAAAEQLFGYRREE